MIRKSFRKKNKINSFNFVMINISVYLKGKYARERMGNTSSSSFTLHHGKKRNRGKVSMGCN